MQNPERYSPDLAHTAKENIFYALTMFPYPSGSGLHCGHASIFTINDVVARYQRMLGKTVFQPFGFDAFGLPTENYAMKMGKPAYEVTETNKQHFIDQLQALNISFDRERVIDTSKPDYYKWTQRIFQQLYKAGLVYRDELRVNRCPDCQTVLANDQVVDGTCERCKHEVIQKKMPQWFIKITDYADRLLEDLDTIDRPEETKIGQRNWIGKSEGLLFTAPVKDTDLTIQTFSAHFEACHADTFVAIAPEHEFLPTLLEGIENKSEILSFCDEIIQKRTDAGYEGYKEIEGMFTGRYIEDPLGNGDLPIWVASFALANYGTGIVKCSAHDERDFEFAKKYAIPLKVVLVPEDEDLKKKVLSQEICYTDMKHGYLTEPTHLSGKLCGEVRQDIVQWCKKNGWAETKINYKLRDRSVSRQRYWGSPIPVYYDEYDQPQLIPEEELPVLLPLDVANYKPKGKSPLEDHPTFPIYKKKPRVLLIHGRGNSQDNPGSLGGVRRALQKQGCEIIFPNLTYHQDFDFAKVMKDLDAYDVDMVVGHSAGGYLALQYAIAKGIKQVTLIVPTIDSEHMNEGIKTWAEDVFGKDADKVLAFHDAPLDFDACKDKEISFFFGEKDTLIDGYFVDTYQKFLPHATNTVLSGRGHMGSLEGTDSIEEINDFLKSKVGSLESVTYRRECDTLDTFMCSSFYFLRYPDAHNDKELISKALADKMFPIQFYSGGKEHTVGHLLYARFIHKFLYDQGYVPSAEPVQKLVHQGMVLGADGRKMGKRYGNGVDPLEVIEKYGADAVRTYLMFMGPVEQDKVWNDNALHGVKKFLDRVERLLTIDRRGESSDEVESVTHQTIQGITHDMEHMKFNTAVSKLMILVNEMYDQQAVTTGQLEILTLLLAPFATELAEKMRELLGHGDDVHFAIRPIADESKIQQSSINLPIQINGKMRGNIDIDVGLTEDEVLGLAKTHENIVKWLEGKDIKKVIWVQDKILNIIIS